ncbi:STM4014 family protein [Mycobacteroides abscessus]|uniref:STM4014 family protein n=1 Tax=Mycobacteroides abscessus TaxID=36809 RepID=UPI000C261AFD|nr:STM4014 family protein [Mycobacteroides abscessus]
MTPPAALTVIGDPDGRRTALLRRAAVRAGIPLPRTVSWLDVLTRAASHFGDHEIVRIDSPGGNRHIDALLRGPGDPTRIADGPRWYSTLCRAVNTVHGRYQLTAPEDVAVLFDKRRCHAHLAAQAIPVPHSPTSGALTGPSSWPEVRALAAAAGLRRFFIKPAHGSSAAGVVAVETANPGRVQAHSSAELTPCGLYNSLRVRRLTGEREVGALIDALAPEQLHIEAWLPKPVIAGRAADLRIVVIAGRATHAVLRTGASPMTNLHLGGRRADWTVAQAAFEASGFGWSAALQIAEAAATRFPRTMCVGVDLLPAANWRAAHVGEVNAFGDLLPGLTGLPARADGQDTYDAQVAAMAGWVGRAAA